MRTLNQDANKTIFFFFFFFRFFFAISTEILPNLFPITVAER